MTDTQINGEIAKALGWLFKPMTGPLGRPWEPPEGKRFQNPPSYTTDLNAMHEAEDYLRKKRKWKSYLDYLVPEDENEIPYNLFWSAAHASPRDRAEAFLRTLGLWNA